MLSGLVKINDDGYVQAMPNELLEMMWEITRDAWAFRGGEGAERRLQRNVTNLEKKELGQLKILL